MTRVPLTLEDGRRVILVREGDELRLLGASSLTPDELATLRAHRDTLGDVLDLVARFQPVPSTQEVSR